MKLTRQKIEAKCGVKASEELKEYKVSVNFGGFIGGDEEYSVDATSDEEAENEAIEMAADDLNPEDVNQIDDDEWEVTISFAGFIGVEDTYTVFADDEDEAIGAAIEEAKWDLTAEIVTRY